MRINLNILVLVNSETPYFAQAFERVLPYLEHFGIPYDLVDLRTVSLPAHLNQYPLFLVAHPGLDECGIRLSSSDRKALKDAIIPVVVSLALMEFLAMLWWVKGKNDP